VCVGSAAPRAPATGHCNGGAPHERQQPFPLAASARAHLNRRPPIAQVATRDKEITPNTTSMTPQVVRSSHKFERMSALPQHSAV